MPNTSSSAINQQIAPKNVGKLHSSAGAVWDGQEALDYLLEEPSPEHSRPDIMDGYHATRTIRTHERFKNLAWIRNTPIVAMTASAIQGDRQKCQKAGIDYLTKPAKGELLGKMLVKCAIKGKPKQEFAQKVMSKLNPRRRGSILAQSSLRPFIHNTLTYCLSILKQRRRRNPHQFPVPSRLPLSSVKSGLKESRHY